MQIKCPTCGTPYSVADTQPPCEVVCARCDKPFTVSAPEPSPAATVREGPPRSLDELEERFEAWRQAHLEAAAHCAASPDPDEPGAASYQEGKAHAFVHAIELVQSLRSTGYQIVQRRDMGDPEKIQKRLVAAIPAKYRSSTGECFMAGSPEAVVMDLMDAILREIICDAPESHPEGCSCPSDAAELRTVERSRDAIGEAAIAVWRTWTLADKQAKETPQAKRLVRVLLANGFTLGSERAEPEGDLGGDTRLDAQVSGRMSASGAVVTEVFDGRKSERRTFEEGAQPVGIGEPGPLWTARQALEEDVGALRDALREEGFNPSSGYPSLLRTATGAIRHLALAVAKNSVPFKPVLDRHTPDVVRQIAGRSMAHAAATLARHVREEAINKREPPPSTFMPRLDEYTPDVVRILAGKAATYAANFLGDYVRVAERGRLGSWFGAAINRSAQVADRQRLAEPAVLEHALTGLSAHLAAGYAADAEGRREPPPPTIERAVLWSIAADMNQQTSKTPEALRLQEAADAILGDAISAEAQGILHAQAKRGP